MKTPSLLRSITAMVVASLAGAAVSLAQAPAADAPGATKVLKWPEGKKACFLLAFDDGAPSQLKNVIPELDRRKIVGTFYLVTGNSLYAALKPKWEEAVKSPYIVPANHTFTHKGVMSVEELDPELAKNNEVLLAYHPDRPKPRLLGFGKPGGVPWHVPKEDLATALAKHFLIDRPPFWGPPMHYKSSAELVGAVDKAIEKGDMGHADFHGVGADWLVTPMDWFTALLDKLDASRDVVWVTDTVSWHKYVQERESAEIKTLEATPNGIRVELTAKVDPALYDQPLTLSTAVPADWKKCTVTQGATKTDAPVRDGAVQYPAIPGAGAVVIQPVR